MEFRILGALEVFSDGAALSIAGAKERAILADLLLHAGQIVSADRLIDELWGDEPPDAARNSLQVRVSGLRRVLGRERIVSGSGGYLIRIEPGELDLRHFEKLTASGGRDDLDEALALWRGPPLSEFRNEHYAPKLLVNAAGIGESDARITPATIAPGAYGFLTARLRPHP